MTDDRRSLTDGDVADALRTEGNNQTLAKPPGGHTSLWVRCLGEERATRPDWWTRPAERPEPSAGGASIHWVGLGISLVVAALVVGIIMSLMPPIPTEAFADAGTTTLDWFGAVVVVLFGLVFLLTLRHAPRL
jgi:hypothetical protein